MKRSHLIIVYFIVYVAVLLTVLPRLLTLREARKELRRIDNAIEVAGEKTAQTLKNHVYEENPKELLKKTFIYTYSLMLQETEDYHIEQNSDLIEDIYLGVNGEIVSDYGQLMEITDSDSLAIYIVLRDILISTPLRDFVVSREFYKEIERN